LVVVSSQPVKKEDDIQWFLLYQHLGGARAVVVDAGFAADSLLLFCHHISSCSEVK